MYEIHYLVPTAGGTFSEKVIVDEGKNFIEGRLSQCRHHGYEVIISPCCKTCGHYLYDCHGEANWRAECSAYKKKGTEDGHGA